MPYGVILLISALGVIGVRLLHLESVYALPWMMIGAATLASVYGIGTGLWAGLLAFLAFLLLYLPELTPQDWFYHILIPALILGISIYIAQDVGASLRRAHRRTKALARSLRLQVKVLEHLFQAETRSQILQGLPRLLASLINSFSEKKLDRPLGSDRNGPQTGCGLPGRGSGSTFRGGGKSL